MIILKLFFGAWLGLGVLNGDGGNRDYISVTHPLNIVH